MLWQRYHRKKLVDWLGFFNGRRLVPIIMAFVGAAVGVLVGLGWQPIGDVITSFGEWMTGLGSFGAGLFGLVNRALIPIGMHQFLNTVAWFQSATTPTPRARSSTATLPRSSRATRAPAVHDRLLPDHDVRACRPPRWRWHHCARPERRKAVGGMMVSLALTSFVTGVTEPIEFSFMFVAPLLYAIHAVLTGTVDGGDVGAGHEGRASASRPV